MVASSALLDPRFQPGSTGAAFDVSGMPNNDPSGSPHYAVNEQHSPHMSPDNPDYMGPSLHNAPKPRIPLQEPGGVHQKSSQAQKMRSYNGIPLQAQQPDDQLWKQAHPGTVPVRHLLLQQKDQDHRVEAAPCRPGYCVDELCACHKHQCLPPVRQIPFEAQTTYRTEYVNKFPVSGNAKGLREIQKGPDGVPFGVDPRLWKDYISKYGEPSSLDNLPAYLFYQHMRDNRDFATETRAQYTPKNAAVVHEEKHGVSLGPDGVPYGVDPKLWHDFVAKHGVPSLDNIPAYLFHRQTPDTRDFVTEKRAQYTAKPLPCQDPGYRASRAEAPPGVDPQKWEEYVAKHGVPSPNAIPASLFYRGTSETRDFTTTYRGSYTPYTIDVCPLVRLPPYPVPSWPKEHTFWDPVAKKWY